MGFEEEAALERDFVMSTFARKNVEFVSGHGMVLIDSEGKEYLDFLAGIGVAGLGHCHPSVTRAVEEQTQKLMHVGNYFYIERRGELAEMISHMLSAGVDDAQGLIWKSFFANSGAEANECAIKLARLYARKHAEAAGCSGKEAPRLIVTLEGSFHGRTLATLAATAQPVKQEMFLPLPDGFITTPINDIAALERLFAERGDEICAVMVECIQGESGIHPCTEEFLRSVRTLTDEHRALLICDEVQSGCYRTGKPFAFQHFGISADIVTIAKGIASGIPCGVCSAHARIADAFEPGGHGSTFGGSNIAVTAAYSTLQVMQQDGFAEHVDQVGAYLRDCLARIDGVDEVRGLGLMVGADLAEDAPSAPQVIDAALQAGLIINATGSKTLRFLPPLICGMNDVDVLIEGLSRIIGA